MLSDQSFDLHAPASPRSPSPRNAKPDDVHLWQNVQQDNALAFSVLYKHYTQKLYNFGMHFCRDRELVLDCIQELFTTLWSRRHQLVIIHTLNAYLFTSFRRLLLKRLTWQRRFMMAMPGRVTAEFGMSLPVESDMLADEQELATRQQLSSNLKCLTRRQREAVFLKFFNELTYAEIAAVMGMSVESAYNVISKGLDALRRSMKA